MLKPRVPIDRMTWTRFVRAIRNFVTSEVGWKAKGLFAGLLALLFGISGMNVVNSQSAMAFTMLLGAFSLIITQFQSISSFTAVVARLSSLAEAVENLQSAAGPGIEICEEEGRVAYERLTLLSPEDGPPLLKDLSLFIPSGRRVLILGSNEAPKAALSRLRQGFGTGEKDGSSGPVVRACSFWRSVRICRRAHCGRFSHRPGRDRRYRKSGFSSCSAG